MGLEAIAYRPPGELGLSRIKGYRIQGTNIELVLYDAAAVLKDKGQVETGLSGAGSKHVQIKTPTGLDYDDALEVFAYISKQEPDNAASLPNSVSTREFQDSGKMPNLYLSFSDGAVDIALLSLTGRFYSWWANSSGERPFFNLATTKQEIPDYASEVFKRVAPNAPDDLKDTFDQAMRELFSDK